MKIKKLHGKENHLIFDGFCRETRISEIDFIKDFLIDFVKEIRMHAISSPLVLYHKAEGVSESGVTGVIILSESNITIHTYPEKKWFALDIFSCNEFNVEKVKDFIKKKLKVFKEECKLFRRGFYDRRD